MHSHNASCIHTKVAQRIIKIKGKTIGSTSTQYNAKCFLQEHQTNISTAAMKRIEKLSVANLVDISNEVIFCCHFDRNPVCESERAGNIDQEQVTCNLKF